MQHPRKPLLLNVKKSHNPMKTIQRTEIDQRFLKAYRILYVDGKVDMKKDFCKAVGMIPQNFSVLERGDLSCTVDNIYNLATTFGVSLDWIFFGVGEFYKQ